MTHAWRDLYWQSRDGLRLHARDYPGDGAKIPVVCIPGLTRNAADFDELATRLAARGHRVICVELRGRGGSERDPKPSRYRPPTYAQDVLGLLAAQGIARAAFIGTSLGGIVTMAITGTRPEVVAAVVLNDVGPDVPRAAIERIAKYTSRTLPPMSRADAVALVRNNLGAAHPGYGEDDWARLATRVFRVRDDGLWELDYDPAVVRPMPPWLMALLRPLMWRGFRKLANGRPTLVVRGALSDVLDDAILARMRREAPALRVCVVPDTGHAPDLDQSPAVEAIESLLDVVGAT